MGLYTTLAGFIQSIRSKSDSQPDSQSPERAGKVDHRVEHALNHVTVALNGLPSTSSELLAAVCQGGMRYDQPGCTRFGHRVEQVRRAAYAFSMGILIFREGLC